MKWSIAPLLVLIALLVLAAFPSLALADGPQPLQYGLIQCSGMGAVQEVQAAEQVFDTQYGFDHALPVSTGPNSAGDWAWRNSYIARVNEFAASVGCGQALRDDVSLAGVLTLPAQHYSSTYLRYLRNYPQ